MGAHEVEARDSDARPDSLQAPGHLMRQPLVGVVTSALSLGLILASAIAALPLDMQPLALAQLALLAAILMGALYLSYQFPIHIRHTVKLEMGSVPLYLMAVLLPVPIAAMAALVGTIAGEMAVRRARGNLPSDIATQAGRWSVVVLAGSAVAHVHTSALSTHMALVALTAGILLAGDMVTMPLSVCPITGERPLHILVLAVRSVCVAEAGQYFLGLIGALVSMHDVWGTSLLLLPIALLYRISKRSKEMHEMTRQLLLTMADEVDQRDPYTGGHSRRVTEHVAAILQQVGVTGPEAKMITSASQVHDIGKMWTPQRILNKHESLTAEEWEIMARHSLDGAQLLRRYPDFAQGAEVVESHHERWDGKGYPHGVRGTDIPFGARVIAVADAFDAMTADRPYRNGMPVERAAAILAAGAGSQWDPQVVEAFLTVIADRYPQSTALLRADSATPAATRETVRI